MCLTSRLGLLCLLFCFASSASAEMTLVEDFEVPAVDGTIWCIQEFDGELVVGGLFEGLGRQQVTTLASWDGARWASLGLEEINQDRVYAMAVLEGDLVVATSANWSDEPVEYWESFNGLHRVLRRTTQGWVQVGGNLRHQPRALVVHQGELFVGLQSSITTRGEFPLHRLVDGAWQPAGLPAGEVFVSIHALVSDGQTLFVGGSFEGPDVPGEYEPAGFPRGVYAWQDGIWSLVGDGLQSDRMALSNSYPMGRQGVHDLALYQGQLYATGSFVNETEMHAGFARFDGTNWEPLPSIGVGYHLTEVDEGLVVTGLIAHEVAGEYRYDLVVFDGQQWIDFDPGAPASPVTTAAGSWRGGLVVARDGTMDRGLYGSPVPVGPGLTHWDRGRWRSLILGRAPNSPVHAITEFEGALVIGGSFDFAGAAPAAGVARLQDGVWQPFGEGLFGGTVVDFAVYRGQLVAGGSFLAPGEDRMSGVAFWNGDDWMSLTPAAKGGSTDGRVRSLAVYRDELWVAGRFRHINGVNANGLARFDGTTWHGVTVYPEGSGATSLAVFGGGLIVGGSFDHVGGIAASGLARFDGTQWLAVQSAGQMAVTDLEAHDELLYVARSCAYSYPCTDLRPGLYAWDGVDSLRAVTDPDDPGFFVDQQPYDLQSDGNALHALTLRSYYERDLVTWNGQRITDRNRADLWGGELRTWIPYTLGVGSGDLWVGGRWWVGDQWTPGQDPASRTLARLDPGTTVALPEIDLIARNVERGVRLTWSASNSREVEGVSLEHARGDAAWSVVWDGNGQQEWLHPNPGPGLHRYRLIVRSDIGPVVSAEARVEIARPATRIRAALPNPFNPSTEISFEVSESGPVSLRVFDLAGRHVRTLVNEHLVAGQHATRWHGEDGRGRGAASGVYLIVLETRSGRDVRRVALVQ